MILSTIEIYFFPPIVSDLQRIDVQKPLIF